MAYEQVSGLTTFQIDGVSFDVNTEISYNVTLFKKEYIPNWSQKFLYGAPPQTASVKAKLIDVGLSKQNFLSMDGVTVQVQQANGYTVILANASCTEVSDVSVSAESTTFEVTFMSCQVTELPPVSL